MSMFGFAEATMIAAIVSIRARAEEDRQRRACGLSPAPARAQALVPPAPAASQWTSPPASSFGVAEAVVWGSVIGSMSGSAAASDPSPTCSWAGDGGMSGGGGATGEW